VSVPVPILLIHGYDGTPESWDTSGFRAALIEAGAEPALIRLFRAHNNQADIREIAARLGRHETEEPDALESQIARLSEASVAQGGPEKVTLVAHSMGGLVARYYLSRRTPDEWGTVNEGLVARLITIATPHQGVWLAQVTRLVSPDALIMRFLRALERLGLVRGTPAQELAQLDHEVRVLQERVQAEEMPIGTQGYFDSPAVRQLVPGSPFLQQLNAPGSFPADVESTLIWGDVQVTGSVRWGPLLLWERALSLGDLLIPADSASTLPIARPAHHPFLWKRHYEIHVNQPAVAAYDLNEFLPPVSHSNLLRNREVQALVARLVGL
jgi:pimeloyl-ACP methyl ester carboxylesterase